MNVNILLLFWGSLTLLTWKTTIRQYFSYFLLELTLVFLNWLTDWLTYWAETFWAANSCWVHKKLSGFHAAWTTASSKPCVTFCNVLVFVVRMPFVQPPPMNICACILGIFVNVHYIRSLSLVHNSECRIVMPIVTKTFKLHFCSYVCVCFPYVIFLFCFQRPTAKELLKFPFIRKAKKNSYLVDLIDRYKKWKSQRSEESETESENSDS